MFRYAARQRKGIKIAESQHKHILILPEQKRDAEPYA